MWYNLIIALVMMAASYALRPKQQGAKPATLSDVQAPTAETGRAVPVIFGTVKVAGPNCLWFGDLSTSAIKKSSK